MRADSHRVGTMFTSAIGIALFALPAPAQERVISLAGEWSFRLDPQQQGQRENWSQATLTDRIRLPGSTAQAGFGDPVTMDTKWTGQIVDRSWFTDPRYEPFRRPGSVKVPFWLQPVQHYVGAAWYQRRVSIPPDWSGRRVVLSLERCHWETRVWVDGREAGTRNSLAVAHTYDLTDLLPPGEHTLAICVDNSIKIDVGVNAHSVSDHTQTNWNGIIGAIELRAIDAVSIADVQVYPDIEKRTALVRVTVSNQTGRSMRAAIRIGARLSYPQAGEKLPDSSSDLDAQPGLTSGDFEYPMSAGEAPRLWDEFSPNLYTMTASVRAGAYEDTRRVEFGMRRLGVEGTQFTVNGRRTFVRGTLDCCIFPLTGYPPTDVESWMHILKTAKAHGLNQLRFHSWCPPEAAFIAGDRLGFMHQVECDVWTTVGDGGPVDAFIREEADRILATYGNHPSFCFLAHGNEPGGARQKQYLGSLVTEWKKKDTRRLYTSAAGWPLLAETDYHSTPDPRVQRWGEGLQSRINARPPETMTDYRDFVQQHGDKPVVSHEIGQWCVYPDFKEIDRYTGVLRARNFEIFRDSLRANHMGDQAEAFLLASGKLQTLCYKEDIEAALRTPGFGGFQLLDLHDFPGQGTALVGVLNPFWGSKGYVSAEEYRRFCCETVPLARMAKRIWTSDETFEATIEVAHFGPAPIEGAPVHWLLAHEDGRVLSSDRFAAQTLAIGNGRTLGAVRVPLSEIRAAARVTLVVGIEGTSYANDWPVWVYPPAVETTAPSGVLIADRLDQQALTVLRGGGKVVLLPGVGRVAGDEHGRVPPGFSSIFWNTAWTHRQPPHTLGILCDPKHPALAKFPTEGHSNWQWWELMHRSQVMILNGLPPRVRPLVQVIDDWVTNRRLGLVFEARVEGGKLLVCGMDLETDLATRPVARQMRHSLLAYAASDRFAPAQTVSREAVDRILSGTPCLVMKVDSEAAGHEGCLAADGSPATCWHTPWGDHAPGYPHEIQLKLDKPVEIAGLSYLPRQDMQNGWISRYEVYVSHDPGAWGEAVAQGRFERTKAQMTIRFRAPVAGRYVRFVAVEGIDGQPFAAIAELELITADSP